MMPLPLTRVTNTSRGVRTDSTTTPDDGVEPKVIRQDSAGTKVFPYRGIETHGVDPTAETVVDPEEADYGTTRAVPFVDDPVRPDPVGVYIVSDPDSGPDPIDDWGANREYVRVGECRRILGQNQWRSNTVIKNTHATDTLYVAHDDFSDINLAFPIAPGGSLTLSRAVTPVYARVSGSNPIDVAISYEFSIPSR